MPNFLIKHYDNTPVFREGTGAEKVGTPIVAWEPLYDGALVPGFYDFTFSSVDPGVDATVHIAAPSGNFKIHGRTVTGVPLDESWITDVFPGIRFKLNDDPGFLSTWKTRLYLSPWMGNHKAGNPDAEIIDASDGPTLVKTAGEVGGPAYYARWIVRNTSGQRSFETYVVKSNFVHLERLDAVGKALSYGFTDSIAAVEKYNPADGGSVAPYVFTFGDKDDAGPGLISFEVDGGLISDGVLQVASGTTSSSANVPYGELLRFTAAAGDLEDCQIMISPDVEDDDAIDCYVFAPRYSQWTPDSGTGNPVARREDEGGALWGTTDMGLTQIGEGVREMESNGEVTIHTKTIIPVGAPRGLNPGKFTGFVIKAGLSLPVGI